MKFRPQKFQLKNGQEVSIREAIPEDAPKVLALTLALRAEGTASRSTPEEKLIPESEQAAILDAFHRNPNAVHLLAEIEGELAGQLDFSPFGKQRLAHVGEFGIGFYPPFRGLGIGKIMLVALIDWAKAHPQLEKIGLSVFSDNIGACHLYEKLGFQEEGRLYRQIKFEDGRYVDEVKMGLWVGEQNAQMNT